MHYRNFENTSLPNNEVRVHGIRSPLANSLANETPACEEANILGISRLVSKPVPNDDRESTPGNSQEVLALTWDHYR
jgi:hypothetical protein